MYLFQTVLVAVWSAGWDETRQPPIESEKYQCRIDTVSSPDDGHMVAVTRTEVEINILNECVSSWFHLKKIIQGCTVNKT